MTDNNYELIILPAVQTKPAKLSFAAVLTTLKCRLADMHNSKSITLKSNAI